MKKVLFLFVALMQGMFLQGVNQYKYFNRLPDESPIKCACEKLSPGRFFKSKNEKSCDFLDRRLDSYVQEVKDRAIAKKQEEFWRGCYWQTKDINFSDDSIVLEAKIILVINDLMPTMMIKTFEQRDAMVKQEYNRLDALAKEIGLEVLNEVASQ